MFLSARSAQISNYVLLTVVFSLAAAASFFIKFSGFITIGFIAVFVFLIAFLNTDIALTILIFSMLLSPEFALGGIKGREIVLRADDIFIFVIFAGWLTKMAINQELGFLRFTPLNWPIMMYVGVCAVSSLIAIMRHEIAFKNSVFYFLKYFEYFLLFFLVTNNLRNINQVKRFIGMMIFVAMIVSVFAYFLRFSGAERVTAPFEGKYGEPNTLGGYLVIMLMITGGLFVNLQDRKHKSYLLAVIALMFPALLFTLSRESWLGFIFAFLTLIFFTPRGKFILIFAGLIIIGSAVVIMPRDIIQRANYTFSAETEREIFGKKLKIDESTAARIDSWAEGARLWLKAPLLGHGTGCIAVIDNQYARVLVETGFFGMFFFIAIIYTLFKISWRNLKIAANDGFACGIIAGFIACLVEVLVHGLSAASFIIIRIMEPFWFFAAIAVMLPELMKEEKAGLENK